MKTPRTYYLDVETIQNLEKEARERGTDKAVIVREALQQYFDKEDGGE